MADETITWLEAQLRELDRWRWDLVSALPPNADSQLARLDAHRQWLERELDDLLRRPACRET